LLTCISPLLLAQRFESEVLEACDLRFQETQVDQRGTAVVLTLELVHALSFDAEDGEAAPVHTAHVDAAQLTAAQESQSTQEEVLGLKHVRLPRSHARGLNEESRLR
jgi:hypothetical protein